MLHLEALKLDGPITAVVTKLDNGYSLTVIEIPAQPLRKPPTDVEVNKRISEMVKGMVEFQKAMGQLSKDGDADAWKGEGLRPINMSKLVEHFKAMNPSIVQEIRDQMCPPVPHIDRLVFGKREELLHFLASRL